MTPDILRSQSKKTRSKDEEKPYVIVTVGLDQIIYPGLAMNNDEAKKISQTLQSQSLSTARRVTVRRTSLSDINSEIAWFSVCLRKATKRLHYFLRLIQTNIFSRCNSLDHQ